MDNAAQIQDDLHFVRQTIARREANRSPAAILYLWAVYVLVGYTMIDLVPKYCGLFFMIGGIAGGIITAWLGRRHAIVTGERDRLRASQALWHWFGGIALAMLFTFALASVIPALRGTTGSQVLVVMIGLVYFLAGIHFDRQFLWLGPILMIGGVTVGLVPHYGWTCLGAVIAVGLVVPTFFRRAA